MKRRASSSASGPPEPASQKVAFEPKLKTTGKGAGLRRRSEGVGGLAQRDSEFTANTQAITLCVRILPVKGRVPRPKNPYMKIVGRSTDLQKGYPHHSTPNYTAFAQKYLCCPIFGILGLLCPGTREVHLSPAYPTRYLR
jgi:hypothetical protein